MTLPFVLSVIISGLVWCVSALAYALYSCKSQAKTQKKTLDISAADLLHDLTVKGHAVLKVEVIDMANLLLRSPRD